MEIHRLHRADFPAKVSSKSLAQPVKFPDPDDCVSDKISGRRAATPILRAPVLRRAKRRLEPYLPACHHRAEVLRRRTLAGKVPGLERFRVDLLQRDAHGLPPRSFIRIGTVVEVA
jgi:hypothetical protein